MRCCGSARRRWPIPSGRQVGVVTKAGRWNATLTSRGRRLGARRPGQAELTPGQAGWRDGTGSRARSSPAVPGLLLGWSWPDLLQHAVAVAAAADSSGDVNLAVYERLVDGVTVESAR